ncbi:hypothetical protein JCM6882_004866 [Rhodosporidiobolus microsporus]
MFFSSRYAGASAPNAFCTPAVASTAPSGLSDGSTKAGGGDKVGDDQGRGTTNTTGEEDKVFDYVICGGGTAGCVLASRLSGDPSVNVLLIEAGETDQKELMSCIPAGTHLDWDYTTVPQPALNNRELFQPRGKMLGGCSAMNAQIYQRCAPGDYDDWAANGAPGWAWRDLKPFFDKAEGFVPNPEYKIDEAKRNTKGPYVTGYPSATCVVSKAFVETGPAVGLPKNPDLNVETDVSGITRFQTSATSSGVRSSTSAAYLPPSVFRSRPNLKILTGTLCTRVLFADEKDNDGNAKIIGVEVAIAHPKNEAEKAKRWIARAHPSKGEYVVSLGAYGSPQLLLCSGIGRESSLQAAGVVERPLSVEVKGVGEGLKDHLKIPVSWTVKKGTSFEWLKSPIKSLPSLLRWFLFGTGPLTSNVAEAGGFLHAEDVQEDGTVKLYKGSARAGGPDLEVICAPIYYQHHTLSPPPIDTETQDFWSAAPVVLKPFSTGRVSIKSGDVREKAVIDPGYFTDERDIELIRKGLHLLRRMSQSPPLKDYLLSVACPRMSLDVFAALDDESLLKHAREVRETIYHPMCSCQMGPLNKGGVVDPATLKVYGTSNLRVCDASVFPDAVGGHPCAPVVAVAEKFADMLKREREAQGAGGVV